MALKDKFIQEVEVLVLKDNGSPITERNNSMMDYTGIAYVLKNNKKFTASINQYHKKLSALFRPNAALMVWKPNYGQC